MRSLLVAAALALGAGAAAAQPLPPKARAWLERDVVYLITDAERAAFGALTTDADRDRFISEFWRRRDPTPETDANEFQDEHNRRLAEADRRFSSGTPGWKTDRGRIYISWGPPDFVETNPMGGRGFALGALSQADELPTEIWTYEHLPARVFGASHVQIVFVDRGGGDYRILGDPNDANLAYVYRLNTAANPLQYESAAFFDPVSGLKRTDRTAEIARSQVLGPDTSMSAAANPFERLALNADLKRTPGEVLEDIERSQRARQLEGDVQAQAYVRRLPLALAVHVFASDGPQAYCPVAASIGGEAITFAKQDRYRATLQVRGDVKDLASGKPVRQFSETLEFRLTPETFARGRAHGFSYHKALALPPGRYEVALTVKDLAALAVGLASTTVTVAKLAGVSISGLMAAERVEPAAPDRRTPFTFAGLSVVPRPGARFGRDETLLAVYQVSGYAAADGQGRLTVDYTILRGETIVMRTDVQKVDVGAPGTGDAPPRPGESASKPGETALRPGPLFFAQPFALSALEPGEYTLQVKAIDHVAGRHAIARTTFIVQSPQM